MKYYKAEFIIECEEDLKQLARELLADIAGETGFESFEETEAGLDGYVQVDLFHKDALDKAIEEFPVENIGITYALSSVIDEDWNKTWEDEGFEPIDIDGKLLVFDAKKPIPAIQRPIEIGIEACNTFGTGTHETTQMILSYLADFPMEGKRVLDCGCGTGILGIAAAKLGANEVICYDIDEWSVRNTKWNSRLNGVKELNVMEGDSTVLSHVSGVFDLVMANINRNTLLQDVEHFKEVLNVGGTLILSGFYGEDAPMLRDKAQELGLEELFHKETCNWCMMVLR